LLMAVLLVECYGEVEFALSGEGCF